jgi:hypothetical protein
MLLTIAAAAAYKGKIMTKANPKKARAPRPNPNPKSTLDVRYMVRTTDPELARWQRRAKALGFGERGAGAYLRKLATDDIANANASKAG